MRAKADKSSRQDTSRACFVNEHALAGAGARYFFLRSLRGGTLRVAGRQRDSYVDYLDYPDYLDRVVCGCDRNKFHRIRCAD